MKLYLTLAVYSVTMAFSLASIESFDNFLLSYGDVDRCNFGIVRSEKSPSINKQGIAVNGKNTLPRNVCVQEVAEHKKHHRSGQILHAVEAAEKTIVSAVRNEVDILFNDKDHPHVKNVSAICKKDTSRTSRRQQQQQQHQQIILSSDRNRFGWGLDQVTDF